MKFRVFFLDGSYLDVYREVSSAGELLDRIRDRGHLQHGREVYAFHAIKSVSPEDEE